MKRLLLAATFLFTATIFGSCEDLGKAIKKSDLAKVKSLSKKLALKVNEANAYLAMACEIVNQRQLALQVSQVAYPPKPKNKFYRLPGLGLAISLTSLIAFMIVASERPTPTPAVKLFVFTTFGLMFGGIIGELVNQARAMQATIKYRKQKLSDAMEIQRILACWPQIIK